ARVGGELVLSIFDRAAAVRALVSAMKGKLDRLRAVDQADRDLRLLSVVHRSTSIHRRNASGDSDTSSYTRRATSRVTRSKWSGPAIPAMPAMSSAPGLHKIRSSPVEKKQAGRCFCRGNR